MTPDGDMVKAAHIIAEALNWVGWAILWAAGIIVLCGVEKK